MSKILKGLDAKGGSSVSFLSIPVSLFLVLHSFSAYTISASLEKNGPMIITNTPEPTKELVSVRLRRGEPTIGVAKGDPTNSSFPILASQ